MAYEKEVVYNGISTSLKTHIFSYVYAILKREPTLSPLMQEIESVIYPIDTTVKLDQLKQALDCLFAEAYNMDSETYHDVVLTFPKY